MKTNTLLFLLTILTVSCKSESSKFYLSDPIAVENTIGVHNVYDGKSKSIHILVALCDNKYQGIVPVPPKIGNGQDPNYNLYWGTAYGVKTYFKRSEEWHLVKSLSIDNEILERIIFKHKTEDLYLIADAYDGKYIKDTIEDFLKFSSGNGKEIITVENNKIGIGGNANLIAYIGHDGLMDFQINKKFKNTDNIQRDVIVLACYSKSYFEPHLKESNVNPLVWTTGLMAPEAYTIHDAIKGYIIKESNEEIRIRAAKAYSKYQKCSLSASKRLLVTN